ncbi:histone-like nucleoid-structuring protein Lsr2 [Saccharomonospora sp. NB11]|uniref:Lsr2 dimerization domain-containing protein n=1 Tax=Saccharomonospora sp. NB11 TaxID=1642298 RepID=UPI0018D0F175|nr:histone-like nucleoid-structuring protein Lsr2 [Saccharomonospora sp. NB11]
MARSTAIYTVDDITGEPAHETVSFAFDGVAYEIDLTAEHADQLRDLLDRYIRHGRRTGGRRLRPRLVTNPVRVLAEPAPRSSRATKRPRRGSAEPVAAPTTQPTARKAPRPTRRRTKRASTTAPTKTRSASVPEVRFSAPEA